MKIICSSKRQLAQIYSLCCFWRAISHYRQASVSEKSHPIVNVAKFLDVKSTIVLAYLQNSKQNSDEFKMQKLVIKNIGQILSGKREEPLIEANCLVAVDGKIKTWGKESDLDIENATSIVDANGVTLSPGLIDSHVHPVVGDYTPRQQQLHWIDSTLHGGVTTMISAGEVHMPGRPKT